MPLIELSMTGRPKSSRVVGIDLGTTNSLVAYTTESGPQVIRDPEGNALVPSIVYYDNAEKRLLVGEAARELGRFAHDRLQIGREALGAAEELADAHVERPGLHLHVLPELGG